MEKTGLKGKSKCCCSCNNINDPFAKLCVPDVVKNLNGNVFNLMSRTNETKHIEQGDHRGWKGWKNWKEAFFRKWAGKAGF